MIEPTKINVPSSLRQGAIETQETLELSRQQAQEWFIGVPREISLQENRVALTPSGVAILTGQGYRVLIEDNAGERAYYSNHEYAEAGAEICFATPELYQKADILLKVAPPTLSEIELMHPNQLLISPLQISIITAAYINKLREKRVIAIAMEYMSDQNESFPMVRIMSEIAGISAMHIAAELLGYGKGRGLLLGGITGVPPVKVIILGAGVVAEFATRAAQGLGAEVRVFDNNVYKLMRLQNMVGRQIPTSTINPITLEKELPTADVVIGAIHSKSGRTPMVVSEDLVAKMKSGAVIIDVSIDQGGCFATSRVTTHDNPTFKYHDVTHYCVPNIASRVPRSASDAITNILCPMLVEGLEFQSMEAWLGHNRGLAHGLYLYKGSLTNRYLSERFGIKYTDIELLIPSRF